MAFSVCQDDELEADLWRRRVLRQGAGVLVGYSPATKEKTGGLGGAHAESGRLRQGRSRDFAHGRLPLSAQSQCQTYNVDYEEVVKGEQAIDWPPMKKEVDLEARVDREHRKKSSARTETGESGQSGSNLENSYLLCFLILMTFLRWDG